MTKLKPILLLLLLFSAYSFGTTLAAEQQQAKQEGLKWFMQGYWEKPKPFLEIAAKAGDSEAQYYFAEVIRLSRRSTTEAYYWYEQAAKQGDIYAMIRLSDSVDYCEIDKTCTKTPKQWKAEAKKQASTRAKHGDAEAMGLMYYLTGDLIWLERSAEAGNAYFQNFLATLYLEGKGTFTSDESRQEAVNKWRAAAANNGYVPAMYNYGYYLARQGKIKEGQEWVLKAVNAGDVGSIFAYAILLADEVIRVKRNIFEFPLNKIEGYGLLSLVMETGGSIATSAEFSLERLSQGMTLEEIEQAKTFADEWKKTHPPLSEFIPKMWF